MSGLFPHDNIIILLNKCCFSLVMNPKLWAKLWVIQIYILSGTQHYYLVFQQNHVQTLAVGIPQLIGYIPIYQGTTRDSLFMLSLTMGLIAASHKLTRPFLLPRSLNCVHE